MELFLVFLMIISISISLMAFLKRRIEELIPIGVVIITLIIYICGLFNNLVLGVNIVKFVIFISLLFNIIYFKKAFKDKNLRIILEQIFTPGLLIYVILYLICIYINKGRIFDDYDEFNHWGLLLKNMFLHNGYGTVLGSKVTFNEYPPFTGTFGFLLLNLKGEFLEDYALIAQNLLYLSIIIPITRNINFKFNFLNIKKFLLVMVFIVATPIIYFDAFFSNLLVDGLIGILFALGLYKIYCYDDNKIYKNIFLITIITELCLIKTEGIFFGIILVIANLIFSIIKKDYKDLKINLILLLIPSILTFSWFFKINISHKTTEWNFNDAVNFNYHDKDEMAIKESFFKAIFERGDISCYRFTLFTFVLILIIYSIYVYSNCNLPFKKRYLYVLVWHSIAIVLFMIGLLWMYLTLFIQYEATILSCFWRYTSTIVISWTMLNNLILCENKNNLISSILLIIVFLVFLPYEILDARYIKRDECIEAIKEGQKEFLSFEKYEKKLTNNDKIYFVSKLMTPFVLKINKYKYINLNIANNDSDLNCGVDEFARILKDEEYDYVFIFKTYFEFETIYCSIFENNEILNDSLYKVSIDENNKVKLLLVE